MRYAGAWRTSTPRIDPRDTEHSVLHAVIRDHCEPFLREVSDRSEGSGLPRFVEHEFRDFWS